MDEKTMLWISTETFLDVDMESTPERETKEVALLIVGCCLTVFIIVLNILMAASLLIGKNYNTFTLCVFHLVALDLAVGTCVSPLSTSVYYNNGNWLYGNVVCSFWTTLDIFLASLVITTCLIINIERILDLTHSTYRLWRELWTWKHFLFIWLSWLAALVVGVPIFYKGTDIHGDMYPQVHDTCYPQWQQPYEHIFLTLMFFLPALLAVISMIIAVVCTMYTVRRYQEGAISPFNGSSASALLLVNLTTLFMILPSIIIQIIQVMNGYSGFSPIVHTIVYWLSLASSAARPILWLFDPEIRSGYAIWYRKCCKCQSVIEPDSGLS